MSNESNGISVLDILAKFAEKENGSAPDPEAVKVAASKLEDKIIVRDMHTPETENTSPKPKTTRKPRAKKSSN